uniref:porin n=1 Tax=Salmonella enterica TaxID=28901 RepID=UPI00398C5F68
AWAQSNVTLYGLADANIEYATNLPNAAVGGSSGRRVAMQSGGQSGSRWGLRGVEDLGSGLSALFVLESGFGVNDGKLQQGGRLFGRQAFVGLKITDAGQFTFGRQYTTLFLLLANFQPMSFANQYDPVVVVGGLNFRSDNTAMYT